MERQSLLSPLLSVELLLVSRCTFKLGTLGKRRRQFPRTFIACPDPNETTTQAQCRLPIIMSLPVNCIEYAFLSMSYGQQDWSASYESQWAHYMCSAEVLALSLILGRQAVHVMHMAPAFSFNEKNCSSFSPQAHRLFLT